MWIQKDITLPQYSRGFHIITDEIIGSISELKDLSVGIIHIFINSSKFFSIHSFQFNILINKKYTNT